MVYINSPLRQQPHAAHTALNALHRRTVTMPRATTTTASTTAPATASPAAAPPDNTGAADFRALFSPKAADAAAPSTPPTAQSMFGANPWISNPGGMAPNGVAYNYNPIYFATPATAAKVAQMVGGTVVETNAITPYGPFKQNQPNEMVQLANGKTLNAGIIADFYNHGYSQQYIDTMVANEVNG